MTAAIGHAAILVGLGLSGYALFAFVLAGRGGDPALVRSGRRAIIGSSQEWYGGSEGMPLLSRVDWDF